MVLYCPLLLWLCRWSRHRAVNYIVDQAMMDYQTVMNEVNRYITWPGQVRLKIILLNTWPKSTLTLRPVLSETSPIIFLCKWNQLDQHGWSLRCGLGPCGRLSAASALLWSSCSLVREHTTANTEAHVLLHDFLQSLPLWIRSRLLSGSCNIAVGLYVFGAIRPFNDNYLLSSSICGLQLRLSGWPRHV